MSTTFVATVLTHTPNATSKITTEFTLHNIEHSTPKILSPHAFEIPITGDFDNTLIQIIAKKHSVDISVQKESIFRKYPRLVVFDMDSTLIQQEVIDEIANIAGVVDQVSKITESAMNGEIDFKESLKRRVGLLKGTPSTVFETIKQRITFTPGAKELCNALKVLGVKMAVVSGGFMPLALYVKAHLGLDYAFANQLEISEDGKELTGHTTGPVVDGVRKAELLTVMAQSLGIRKEQVIAVGDGANDLLMMAEAGLGIAFRAKPKVQAQAQARINLESLINVLHFMGLDATEIAQLS
ncbi:hypothetical protein HK098_004203 [Nowakowskiella sp. JEL0407]|nr:hypothetical protein HK098_004203 [Nowakowskiella sp. JEL0407]